jgi:hypothetical protein
VNLTKSPLQLGNAGVITPMGSKYNKRVPRGDFRAGTIALDLVQKEMPEMAPSDVAELKGVARG